jgi:hypothetical protein
MLLRTKHIMESYTSESGKSMKIVEIVQQSMENQRSALSYFRPKVKLIIDSLKVFQSSDSWERQ